MFITKLNKLFEKHGKIAFIIMLLIIIGPFVLFFGPTSILDAINSNSAMSIVEINGKKYSAVDLAPYTTGVKFHKFINNMESNEEDIMQEAVQRKLLLDIADQYKIPKPTNEEIARSIRSQIYFIDKETKKFDQAAFNNFKFILQTQLNINPEQYDAIIAQDLRIRKFQEGMTAIAKAEATEAAVKEDYFYNNNSLTLLVKDYTPNQYEEIAKENKKLVLEGTDFSAEQIAILKSYYDTNVEPLRQPIELQLNPQEDKDGQKQKSKGNDAIYAAATAFQEEIEENSKLSNEAKNAATTEYYEKLGKYAVPFFQMEQKKIKYVSFPFVAQSTTTTEEATEIYEKNKETFFKNVTKEEALKNITEILNNNKAAESANETAMAFTQKMYKNIAAVSKPQPLEIFTQTAQSISKEIISSDFFDDQNIIGGVEDYTFRAEVYKQVSKEAVVSKPIRGANAYYIAIFIESKPAELPKFEATNRRLTSSIVEQIVNEEAIKIAQAKGAHDLETIKTTTAEEKVKAIKELKFEEIKCTRLSPSYKVDKNIFNALKSEAGFLNGLQTEDGFQIVYVEAITEKTEEDFTKEQAIYTKSFINRKAQEKFQEIFSNVLTTQKVKFLNKK